MIQISVQKLKKPLNEFHIRKKKQYSINFTSVTNNQITCLSLSAQKTAKKNHDAIVIYKQHPYIRKVSPEKILIVSLFNFIIYELVKGRVEGSGSMIMKGQKKR